MGRTHTHTVHREKIIPDQWQDQNTIPMKDCLVRKTTSGVFGAHEI